MAGAGYKLFATGDVLTAAQVNTYLMQQTVMVFASSAARTSALSGVLAEGMVSYLQDTNSLEVYDGSGWVGATGDITALTAGTGINITSNTGPIPTVAIDSTVATLTGTQTLTNKTLTTPVISSITNTGTLTLPTSTDTLVGRATTDTLTNKTLTAPVISTISNTGTLTLPTSTDTLVGRATTDSLTNKILVSPEEKTTVTATAATGTVNYDAVTQGVLYYTSNATGNWTLNIRGASGTTLSSILAVGDAITVTHLVTNGATPYYNNALQIDGSSVTPKYQGGTAFAAGNASSIDAYVYTVVKTAATPTYTVFASQTKFA
jgi:hypothetical protein